MLALSLLWVQVAFSWIPYLFLAYPLYPLPLISCLCWLGSLGLGTRSGTGQDQNKNIRVSQSKADDGELEVEEGRSCKEKHWDL